MTVVTKEQRGKLIRNYATAWLDEARAVVDETKEQYDEARLELKKAQRLASIVLDEPTKRRNGTKKLNKIVWREDGSVKAGKSSISRERLDDIREELDAAGEPLSVKDLSEACATGESSISVAVRAMRESKEIRIAGVDDNGANLYAPMKRRRKK